MKRIPITVLLCAALTAQEPTPSTAEQRYQDAFWAETGKGDLTSALQGYLLAAEAQGPAPFRAKALLRAAELQHRLGRDAEAVATIQALQDRFPDQSDVIGQALARQKEWQEIDLRKNFSEWYQKQLFTPDVQAKVLDLVQEYAAYPKSYPRTGTATENRDAQREHEAGLEAIQGKILAYGVGAVPALEQLADTSVTAQDRTLASRSSVLLLKLGTVPPAGALLLDGDWAERVTSWRTLLTADPETKRTLAAGCRASSNVFADHLRLLPEGDAKLVKQLGTARGGSLAVENETATLALIETLHRFTEDEVHHQLVALSRNPETPRSVRRLIERTVGEFGWRDATAMQWLTWGAECLEIQTGFAAIGYACRSLRANDLEPLRIIVEKAKDLPDYQRYGYHEAMSNGLSHNPVPMQLPWTAELVHTLLMSGPIEAEGYSLGKFRTTHAGRAMLVDAILMDPVPLAKLCATGEFAVGLLYSDSYFEDEYELYRVGDAWAQEISKQVRAKWEQWSGEERVAVLQLIVDDDGHCQILTTERPFPADLREFFEKQAASGPQGEQVKSTLQRIDESWNR